MICAAELIHIFVNSMKTKQRMLLDASAGGSIKSKTPSEVEQLIEVMCRNEYNKEEDKDNEEVLMGQLEASLTEVEKLQEENKSLKEFMQSFGDQIKESNEKLGVQVQAWAKKVEDIGELQAITLRSRQLEPVEPTRKGRRQANQGTPESQIPDSQMPETQPPDTEPTSQDVVDLEKDLEVEKDTTDVPITTKSIPEKPKTVFGSDKPPPEPKDQEPYVPYPNKDNKKEKQMEQLKKMGQLVKQMEIHVPFNDMIQISPPFQKYVKNLVAGKIKLKDEEAIMLTEECSAIFQKNLPNKCKDPGSFTIPCTIGGVEIGRALLDLGASVNLMPLSILKKLNCGKVKPTRMTIILADRTKVHPYGILEDVLVTVDDKLFPTDFVIMDIEADPDAPILLGRPFLTTGKAIIDMDTGNVTFRVDGNEVTFNVKEMMNQKKEKLECYQVDMVDSLVEEELAKAAPGVERAII
jgi:hypothetical protein